MMLRVVVYAAQAGATAVVFAAIGLVWRAAWNDRKER